MVADVGRRIGDEKRSIERRGKEEFPRLRWRVSITIRVLDKIHGVKSIAMTDSSTSIGLDLTRLQIGS